MKNLQKIISRGVMAASLMLGVPGCKKEDDFSSTSTTRKEETVGDKQKRKIVLNYLSRLNITNSYFTEEDTINIPFESVNYSINMQELYDFATNKSIFGGHLLVDTGTNSLGRHQTIANHGALVAKKGESSLERLVESLTKYERKDEVKAQSLLDFVTKEVKYVDSYANMTKEVLKRPNEVLMTSESDCSGKAILYASLLEQTNIDYKLCYLDNHILIAVEGDYENKNGLSFNIGDKTYSIASTAVNDFEIGYSGLNRRFEIGDINYIQKPGKNSKFYDAKTGESLPFMNR